MRPQTKIFSFGSLVNQKIILASKIRKVVSGVVCLVKNKPFIHFFLLISSLDLLYGYPQLETFAQSGSREAQLLLATTLFQGSPKEKQKAVYLLTQAAKQGSGKACYYLGIANWKGIGTSINRVNGKT